MNSELMNIYLVLLSLITSLQKLDFKNVQRRVYDALNVFSAINIVKKYKNKISLAEGGLKYLNQENNEISAKRETTPEPQKPSKKWITLKNTLQELKVRYNPKIPKVPKIHLLSSKYLLNLTNNY